MTAPRGRSLWYQAWRRLLANRMAVAGGMVVVAMAALALAAPLVSPYGYD